MDLNIPSQLTAEPERLHPTELPQQGPGAPGSRRGCTCVADDQVCALQVLSQRVLEAEHFHRHGRAAAAGLRLWQRAPAHLQHQLLVPAALQRLRATGRMNGGDNGGIKGVGRMAGDEERDGEEGDDGEG